MVNCLFQPSFDTSTTLFYNIDNKENTRYITKFLQREIVINTKYNNNVLEM